MSEQKRVRRTPQQIVEDLNVEIEALRESIQEIEEKKAAAVAKYDEKIEGVNQKIKRLEERQKAVLTPKKRKPRKTKTQQIRAIVAKANKKGMKLDEIAEILGVTIEE